MVEKRPVKYIVMTCKDSQLLSKILYVNWLLEIFTSAHRLRLEPRQQTLYLKDTIIISRLADHSVFKTSISDENTCLTTPAIYL